MAPDFRTWLLVVLATSMPLAARACDTPVYRYAMYNWQPSPYVLYHLLPPGTAAPAAARDSGSTSVASDSETSENEVIPVGPQLNLVEIAVSTDDKEQVAELPAAVVSRWQQAPADAPLDVLVGPQGTVIDAAPSLAEQIRAASVDSPARRALLANLHACQACVLVLVQGDDAAANRAAETALAEVIAQGRDGKIVPAKLGGVQLDDAPVEIALSTITVARDDLAEQWLVRMLMSVEADLADYAAQPMVFPVYGRARAMEPYIGEGITAENLAECVSFITGSCSCQVKEQNPGVDLLARWDWEATALAMARLVGEEEGNESLLDSTDLLSQAIAATPGAGPTTLARAAGPQASPETSASAPVGEKRAEAGAPPATAQASASEPTAPANSTDGLSESPRVRLLPPARSALDDDASSNPPQYGDTLRIRITSALVVILAVLAAGTMILIRRAEG